MLHRARRLGSVLEPVIGQGYFSPECHEVITDEQMAPALRALGAEAEELFEILAPWGEAIRVARGYLPAGPHDLG